jgi:hypothetical protein
MKHLALVSGALSATLGVRFGVQRCVLFGVHSGVDPSVKMPHSPPSRLQRRKDIWRRYCALVSTCRLTGICEIVYSTLEPDIRGKQDY